MKVPSQIELWSPKIELWSYIITAFYSFWYSIQLSQIKTKLYYARIFHHDFPFLVSVFNLYLFNMCLSIYLFFKNQIEALCILYQLTPYVYTDPRPRPSPRPRSSWKSGWKRMPCKVYGLYWNRGRRRGWRTRTRPSVNTFDEKLRDFKKRTRWRTRAWISVSTPFKARLHGSASASASVFLSTQ